MRKKRPAEFSVGRSVQRYILLEFFVFLFKRFDDGISAPLLLRQTQVVVVAPLSVGLGCGEELGSLSGILLLYGCVAYLADEEVLEVVPVGSLAVEREGVLPLSSASGL